MEQILDHHPDARLKVFAVWEPMLPTDWGAPMTWVLARLSDRRVSQFWDKSHLLAQRMAEDAREPQPKPHCCDRRGVLWDLAAVYPAGATWGPELPAAVMFDGPVAKVRSAIESQLTR